MSLLLGLSIALLQPKRAYSDAAFVKWIAELSSKTDRMPWAGTRLSHERLQFPFNFSSLKPLAPVESFENRAQH